ncbi:MAG TPA: hypothetical protein PLI11_02625 [Clostridia bacterium]|nr:hypothetical protein [Clostridiaceae bacterium]HOA30855.1 hypothetical protein [Clostridia bacterium]HPZ51790.1 hypothetical protein [Clostridia bacterium]
MDISKVYCSDYVLDGELDIPEFGFHVKLQGDDLFLGNNSKHRCFRTLRRHFAEKGYKIYAVSCSDDSLQLIIGNCTLCNIQKDLRLFFASYSVFMAMIDNFAEHSALIRMIRSVDDFMNTFFAIAIDGKKDFADCITYQWSGIKAFLTDKWEYGDLISKDEIYMVYNCGKTPYEFAKAVFNRGYPDYQEVLSESKSINMEEDPNQKLINSILADYFKLPENLFSMFPKTREKILSKSLNDENMFGYIVFSLVSKGNSFRKCAGLLKCSYTKVYNAYNNYMFKRTFNNFSEMNKKFKDFIEKNERS